jgi:hypothetical protein
MGDTAGPLLPAAGSANSGQELTACARQKNSSWILSGSRKVSMAAGEDDYTELRYWAASADR